MRFDRWFRADGAAARVLPARTSPPVAPRATRWTMLAKPDFRRLWAVGFVISAVRWLEMLAVGVFVYQHTGSAFDVALMTLLRMLPLALFGAVIGALAERMERRKALIGVVLLMLTTSLALAVLAHAGVLAVWHLALASFCNGAAWASDNSVRRVMIGEVVGPENMGSAMSLDVGGNNASRMLGPTLGGALLAWFGISGAFTASVLFYVIGLAAAIGVQHRNVHAAAPVGGVLARIVEGFVLVRREPRLIGILLVTIVYNVFGWPFTSMIPVIGQDHLHLGAGAIGVLASMDGIGAFIGVLAIAVYARPAHYAALYIGGVALYMAMLIVFALVPSVPIAGLALLLTGVSNAGFSVMQATLIYLAAPPEMRSRLYGVLSVCIGSGPIGFLALGVLADLIGASMATILSGVVGLCALAATWPWWRRLGEA
ncbi:MAG: MFS transporter [Alphaproteobacteria bacterium]